MGFILKKRNGEIITIGEIKVIDMNVELKNRIIKACKSLPNCDLCKNTIFLSFKKNQCFYVLSYNKNDQTYFVTTDYSLPFSRNSRSGIVPVSYFN